MRIFPPAVQIGELEGFSTEKDLFGRSRLAAGLTNLLSTVTEPTVVAVDGRWGAGKSTFLQMWAGQLRVAGFPVVMFDAFANDFADDAFTAIASEIVDLVREKSKSSDKAAKVFIQKAVGAGKVILRSGIRLGVKVATLNALDTKELEDAAKVTSDELSGLADKYVGEQITKQREAKGAIAEFQEALSLLPALLAPASEGGEQKPLIIIIDELDRCKPVFALSILERMKHFYSVPNVHFVLGAHLGQLRNSVVAAYGTGIDANKYLQKFIHVVLPLTANTSGHSAEKDVTKFVNYIRNSMEFRKEDQEAAHYAAATIRYVAEHRDLTLRTIERIFTVLAIALGFSKSTAYKPAAILGGLCVLKVIEPELFIDAKRGRLKYDDASRVLGLNSALVEDESMFEWAQSEWKFALSPDVTEEFLEGMRRGLPFGLRKRDLLVPYVANYLIDQLWES